MPTIIPHTKQMDQKAPWSYQECPLCPKATPQTIYNCPQPNPLGAFSHSAGTARAQCAHSANYYGDYPGNNPENHPPAESCTINSNLKNSNI